MNNRHDTSVVTFPSRSEIRNKVKLLNEEAYKLLILQVLEESSGYTTNEGVIYDVLNGFSYHLSLNEVQKFIEWLDNQSLVETVDGSTGVQAAQCVRLTQLGFDVANGRALVSGVKRLEPFR